MWQFYITLKNPSKSMLFNSNGSYKLFSLIPALLFFTLHSPCLKAQGPATIGNSGCNLEGNLFYTNALNYKGQCSNNKANGWGTLSLNNGDSLVGYFKDNKIQNLFIEYYSPKTKKIIIGPNIGALPHGPCFEVRDDYSVSFENYDNGRWAGNTDDYFQISQPKLTINKVFCNNNTYNKRGVRIPGTNNAIFYSAREYDSKGNRKYWITLVDLERNQILYNFGSFDKPIMKDYGPTFINFTPNLQYAFFEIRYGSDPPKFLKCDLKSGTFTILQTLPESDNKALEFGKKASGLKFNSFDALNSGKYILLKDSTYIKVFNDEKFAKSYRQDYGTGALLIHFDKYHNVLNKMELPKETIYDFAVDQKNDVVAISYRSKDSTYLSYFDLSSLLKIQDVFVKDNLNLTKNAVPGDVQFSNSGTYLAYTLRGKNTLIFIGTKVHYAFEGELYDFNESENTILVNTKGNLLALDMERKRIIWKLSIGADKSNTAFFKVGNDFIIISGYGNPLNFYRFEMPAPLINLSDFKANEYNLKEAAKSNSVIPDNKISTPQTNQPNIVKSKSDDEATIFGLYLLKYIFSGKSGEKSGSKNSSYEKCQWCNQQFPFGRGFTYTYTSNCRVYDYSNYYCSPKCATEACYSKH
jgi:hypothetical protein